MNLKLCVTFFLLVLLSSCSNSATEGLNIPAVPNYQQFKVDQTALNVLNDAINSSSNSAENFYKRATIYFKGKDFTSAKLDIEKAISIDDQKGKYFFLKSLILNAQSKPAEAISFAERARLLSFKSPELFMLLGDLYQQIRQFSKATSFLNKAVELDPNDGENYFYQGLIAAKKADTLNAIAQFEKSMSLKPSFFNNYDQLAVIYLNQRDYKSSLNYIDKGLVFYPKNDKLLITKGNLYIKSWKIDSAFYCFKSVLASNPKSSAATSQLATLYFKSGDFANALRFFGKTLELDPTFLNLNYQMGLCCEYLGNTAKALEFYGIAIKLHPDDYKSIAGYQRVKSQFDYTNSFKETSADAGLQNFTPYSPKNFSDTSILPARIKISPILEVKIRGGSTKADSLLRKHINAIDKIH